MKNDSCKPTTKCETPKTPGGISKTLLTPCRRVGLSRNWKKSGPSPFISPLAGETSVSTPGSTPVATEKQPSKRKKRILEEPDENTDEIDTAVNDERTEVSEAEVSSPHNKVNIVSTPSRSVQLPRRKKSKKLIETSPSKPVTNTATAIPNEPSTSVDKENTDELVTETLVSSDKLVKIDDTSDRVVENTPVLVSKPTHKKSKEKVKQKSPNNLAKECIVVLQKKMLGKNIRIEESGTSLELKTPKIVSQTLFDSDSDDIPLSSMKKENCPTNNNKRPLSQDDDDFAEAKSIKGKKIEDKKKSTEESKRKTEVKKSIKHNKEIAKPISQSSNSFDDDDDFDFDCKKTILIRKSYDKVSKPTKFKTTGSITQKDIDDIKARIETKKNLLLAKVLTKDTAELRGLIKKWRKGCQDALTELIQLMKMKFPDRQNMDYSEILQTLRIPSALVGYDSDNDCFVSPDDASFVLSKFQ